jgi:hypothetical protein
VVPSPQSIRAVYDEAGSDGLALGKVATTPLNGTPAVAAKGTPAGTLPPGPAASGAGVTVSVPPAKAKA